MNEKTLYNNIKSALIRVFSEIISSKRTLCLLMGAWLANIVFSYYALPASDDEGNYFGEALGFLHKHQMGLYVGDEFELLYAQFPGVPFFHCIDCSWPSRG